MASPRDRKHIFVRRQPVAEDYTPHKRRIEQHPVPAPSSRQAHGKALKVALTGAAADAKKRRRETRLVVHGAVPGLYVEFESQPGVELNLSSLERKQKDRRKEIELVAVTETATDEPESRTIQHATVFVPEGQLKHFVSRFERYALQTPKKKGELRHEDMIDRIRDLRLATLQALWTDAVEIYPADGETIWWEVWLRRHDGKELERLMEFAALEAIDVSPRRLEFDDRIVTLLQATPRQLSASLDVLNDVAEVRKAKETASVFVDMSPRDQSHWAEDLLDRTEPPASDAPVVCVLDTGVTRGHPLLESALAAEDVHACDPGWGTGDHDGHGTEMAGLALYGDLAPMLASPARVRLPHRLESVKILPPRGENTPELYGAITAEATGRAEVQAPGRRRCFSMAVTATDERDRGQPTSWSAAIDALAAGRAFDPTAQGLVYLDEAEDPYLLALPRPETGSPESGPDRVGGCRLVRRRSRGEAGRSRDAPVPASLRP